MIDLDDEVRDPEVLEVGVRTVDCWISAVFPVLRSVPPRR